MAKSRGRSGRRTDYRWQEGNTTQNNIAADGSVQAAITSPSQSCTLYRTRGSVLINMDTSGLAAGDAVRVAWGLFVAGDAGVTSLPTPLTDADNSWLAYGIATLDSQTGVISDTIGGQVIRFDVDSKAMRRIKTRSETIFFVYETVDIVGAPITNVHANFRFLLGS